MSNDDQQGGSPSNKPHPNPTARLRELLSIPERLRTDAQWDEIIDIEISMGPRKPSGNAKVQTPQFRSNDNRGEPRQDKKPAGGNANKHLRNKRHNKGGGGGGGGGNKQGNQGNPGNKAPES